MNYDQEEMSFRGAVERKLFCTFIYHQNKIQIRVSDEALLDTNEIPCIPIHVHLKVSVVRIENTCKKEVKYGCVHPELECK